MNQMPIVHQIARFSCLVHFSILLTFTLALMPITTQSQVFLWAKGIGGPGHDLAGLVGLDKYGNIHLTGFFEDTVDFDPGPGIYNLVAQGSENAYVLKLDPDGNLVWVKSFSSLTRNGGVSVDIDASGNVYTSGYFTATADFDPSTEVFNLHSNASTDMFVSKLDSNGNFLWAKAIGGPGTDYGNGLTLDNQGNVYLTSFFNGTVDFDPGPEAHFITSAGREDVFILKLDTDGDFVWAKSMGGANTDQGRVLKLDTHGDIYVGGLFQGPADFDPNAGTFQLSSVDGSLDAFIARLSPEGNLIWAKSMGGDMYDDLYALALGNDESVYTEGYFRTTADFDPDTTTEYSLTSEGGSDLFTCKYDQDGQLIWARSFGSPGEERGIACTLDKQGNVYSAGEFSGTVDFDPGSGVFNLTSQGALDAFVSKLDSNGDFVWAMNLGSSSRDGIYSLVVDKNGDLIIPGYYGGDLDFDPLANTILLAAHGNEDVFIARYVQRGILGSVYHDFNESCERDSIERGLENRSAVINPGNIIVQTNSHGLWHLDSLQTGDYILTYDTLNGWVALCAPVVNFTVSDPGAVTITPDFAMISGPSATDDQTLNSISVFPIPSSGSITVDFGTRCEKAEIEIFSILGNCLLRRECQNVIFYNLELETGPGAFILVVRTDRNSVSFKVVVY